MSTTPYDRPTLERIARATPDPTRPNTGDLIHRAGALLHLTKVCGTDAGARAYLAELSDDLIADAMNATRRAIDVSELR